MWYKNIQNKTLLTNSYESVPELKDITIRNIIVLPQKKSIQIHLDMPIVTLSLYDSFEDEAKIKNKNSMYIEFSTIKRIKLQNSKSSQLDFIDISEDKNSKLKVDIGGKINGCILAEVGKITKLENN